jgi:hypothetical protein
VRIKQCLDEILRGKDVTHAKGRNPYFWVYWIAQTFQDYPDAFAERRRCFQQYIF